jgi:hypothetical protein
MDISIFRNLVIISFGNIDVWKAKKEMGGVKI